MVLQDGMICFVLMRRYLFLDSIQANTSDCMHCIAYWEDVRYRSRPRICYHEYKLGEVT